MTRIRFSVLTLTLVALPLGYFAAAASTTPGAQPSTVEPSPEPVFEPAPVQKRIVAPALELTLMRLGLGPEQMAAAGCSASDVDLVAAALNGHLLMNPDQIANADKSWADSKRESEKLKRKIKKGRAAKHQVSYFHACKKEAGTMAQIRDALLAESFATATVTLSVVQKSRLETIQSNKDWRLPVQYLAVNRTEKEWVQLRAALDEIRIAPTLGMTVSKNARAIVAAADAHKAVASSKVNCDAKLSSVKTAWKSASK